MSAAILYHVQGIRKYSLRKISIKKGIFIFECFWRPPEELKCAGCRSGNVRRKGTKMRIFTGVPMGNMRTLIHAEIPRVHCLDCGKVAQIHIDFARPNALPRTCRRRIRKRSERIFRILYLSRPISYHADAASDDHGLSTHDLSQIAGRNRPPSH